MEDNCIEKAIEIFKENYEGNQTRIDIYENFEGPLFHSTTDRNIFSLTPFLHAGTIEAAQDRSQFYLRDGRALLQNIGIYELDVKLPRCVRVKDWDVSRPYGTSAVLQQFGIDMIIAGTIRKTLLPDADIDDYPAWRNAWAAFFRALDIDALVYKNEHEGKNSNKDSFTIMNIDCINNFGLI